MDKKVLNYRVIIEPAKYPDGSTVYEASCPTLKVYDYGDSVEEVLNSIKDGIELAIEELVANKEEVPVDDIEKQIITSTRVIFPASFKMDIAS